MKTFLSFLLEGKPYIDDKGNKWTKLKDGTYKKNGVLTNETPDKATSNTSKPVKKEGIKLPKQPENNEHSKYFIGKLPKDKEGEPTALEALKFLYTAKKAQEKALKADYFINAVKEQYSDMKFTHKVEELTFPVSKLTTPIKEGRATFCTIEMESEEMTVSIKMTFDGYYDLINMFKGEKWGGSIINIITKIVVKGFESAVRFANEYAIRYNGKSESAVKGKTFERQLELYSDDVEAKLNKAKKQKANSQIVLGTSETSTSKKENHYEPDEKALKHAKFNLINDNSAVDYVLSKLNVSKACNSISKKLGSNFEYHIEKLNLATKKMSIDGKQSIRDFVFANTEDAYSTPDMNYIFNTNKKMHQHFIEMGADKEHDDFTDVVNKSCFCTPILKITLESRTFKAVSIISKLEIDEPKMEREVDMCPHSIYSFMMETKVYLKTLAGNVAITDYNMNHEFDTGSIAMWGNYLCGKIYSSVDVKRIMKDYSEQLERTNKMKSAEDVYKMIEPDFNKFLKIIEDNINFHYDLIKTRVDEVKESIKKEGITFPYTTKVNEFSRYSGQMKDREKTFDKPVDWICHKISCSSQDYALGTNISMRKDLIKDVRKYYIDEYKYRIGQVQADYGKILDANAMLGHNSTIEANFKTAEGTVHLVTFPAGNDYTIGGQKAHLRTKITLLKNR